jgi:mono/diheme cytochrome c family protein
VKLTAITRASIIAGSATLGMILLTGCHIDMWVQPKVKAQAESDFFPDGRGSRPLVPHTVDRDHLKLDDTFWAGTTGRQMVDGKPAGAIYVDTLPTSVLEAPEFKSATEEETRTKILKFGQERFYIFCSPCHSRLGNGEGMIAQRGFSLRRPPGNYHSDRLRKMPLGYFFDVITNGYGAMTPRAYQVEPRERWAIAAYIRVLQLSQNANESDLTPEQRDRVKAGGAPQSGSGPEPR